MWRDCTHAQSVRENGNRAKWIRSLRKSAREEGRGRDERGGNGSVFARAIETQCYRSTVDRAKLAPARLANIFLSPLPRVAHFKFIFPVTCMRDTSFISKEALIMLALQTF